MTLFTAAGLAYLFVAFLWAVGMWRGYDEVHSRAWLAWRGVKCIGGGLVWLPIVLWVLFLLGKLLYRNLRGR